MEERIALFQLRVQKQIQPIIAEEYQKALKDGLLPPKTAAFKEDSPVKGKIRGIEHNGACQNHPQVLIADPCPDYCEWFGADHPPQMTVHRCPHGCSGRPRQALFVDKSRDWDTIALERVPEIPADGFDGMVERGEVPGKALS